MGPLSAIAGRLVYLDVNALIYAVENVSSWGERVRPVLERIDRGEIQGMTSELSLAETRVGPIRDRNDGMRSEYEQLLGSSSRLLVQPVSRTVLVRAAEVRAAFPPLKLPDAIHAATALLHGCTRF